MVFTQYHFISKNYVDDLKNINTNGINLNITIESKIYRNVRKLEEIKPKATLMAYSKGTYLQKIGDDYFLYHGKFTKDGKKNDENGFFYSAKFDRLFHGKIENDVFIKGYVTYFNPEEGTIENIVYANFDKNLHLQDLSQLRNFGVYEPYSSKRQITIPSNTIFSVLKLKFVPDIYIFDFKIVFLIKIINY